ncbi:hypothetical protein ABSL23_08960 [Halobacterium sp. NMX12-1]|uniref:Uncharacterized protein n=1 Tax=Halobacterium sp. NMX12-1 TaxID=3166650 RepID=A0AAU8C968_9EURY
MGAGNTEPASLTGGNGNYEDAIADRAETVREVSGPLYDAHRDHVRALTEQFHGPEAVAGEELRDGEDAAALREYVRDYCADDVFPVLNDVGGGEDLSWNRFQRALRALVEALYLRAFQRYSAARDHFTRVNRQRREGKEALSDAEAAIDFDGDGGLAGEESPGEAVANAASIVEDAESEVAAAEEAVADAHFYYALAAAYQTEQGIEDAELEGVSLGDDPDWYLQDLRHERDRLATRVEWLRTDFERLADRR